LTKQGQNNLVCQAERTSDRVRNATPLLSRYDDFKALHLPPSSTPCASTKP
jgi:hypothetical protein